MSNLFPDDPPTVFNENPGALAGATGANAKASEPHAKPSHEASATASPANRVADWQRNRWAWKRAVMADRQLPDRAKLLAVVLVDTFANHETGRCTPLMATLAECLGRDERTVRRAVSELRRAGWIDTRTGRGRGARTAFVFLARDGLPSLAASGKVADLAGHRAETGRENRTDLTAYRASEPAERRTNLTGKPDKSVRPYNKDKPKIEPNRARATAGGDGMARPVLFRQCVHRGSSAEREWNQWLALRGLPSLAQIGLRWSDADGPGWDMPWRYPPPGSDERRTEDAERFAWWLVNLANERAGGQAPRLALAAGG